MNFLFCGHDFKFLTPVMNYVSSLADVNVKTLPHKGHRLDDETKQKAAELNEWADIVFCEWALENAVWFSQHKRPGQLLVVRMHFQEYHAGLPYLGEMNMDNVDAMIVICPDALAYMRQHYPKMAGRVHLIYNPLDIVGRFCKPRKAYSDYAMGYLGMVPFRKRPDLALDIFNECAKLDGNFSLRYKGKRPEEYSWMKVRKEEMADYERFYANLEKSPHKDDVYFDGFDPEPGNWYSRCGFILSTSDYEGSHQAVAEGMAQGAIPIIRDWQGASDLYPAEFVWHDVNQAVKKIADYHRSPHVYFSKSNECREFALENFEARKICLAYDELFSAHPQWPSQNRVYPLASMCVAQIVWIPAGVHNGYRVRVSKFSAQYHRLGMRSVIICLHDGKASEEALAAHRAEFEQLGCHAYTVAVNGFFSLKKLPAMEQAAVRDILPILQLERVDVIQAHAIYCARVAAVLKDAKPDLIFSCVFHGVVPEESQMNGTSPEKVQFLEDMEKDILKKVDLANYVSHAMGAHYLAKYGILRPSCVVPSALRKEALRKNMSRRDILKLPTGRPILGYVGTLAAWQCKDEMFALFGALHRQYPKIFFAFLTPQPDQATARELFAKNGIADRDFLIQEVPFEDVSAAVSQFNAGVMLRKFSPVNQVASPTKFGEMVAAGVPMVATDGIGDYSDDVRKNDFGFIVPLEELNAGKFSAETCAGIRKLLDERRNEDPAFVAKTQKFCEENLIWEDHVAKLAEWYRRLKYIKVDGSKAPLPKGNEGFVAEVTRKIAGMPVSNGCRYYKPHQVSIGVICDQFYWDSVAAAANFVYVTPADWKSQVRKIDFLLLVSTWHGLHEDWTGLTDAKSKNRKLVEDIVQTCHKLGKKVVFYSKEDPPNYERYIDLAKQCDAVYTSCLEVVENYKCDCGHDRVHVMRFGINPVYHNPVGMRYARLDDGVIFSGSWMKRHEERCRDLAVIFEGVSASGRNLHIVDRFYDLRGDERYSYPAKYAAFQSPAFDHETLQKVHKLFDWAININTVQDSRTMFANRTYELQASGNLLLTNYSIGVSNTFPTMFQVHDGEEVGRMLSALDAEAIYERQTSGIRRVMTGETCFDRIGELLSNLGYKRVETSRRVLVLADSLNSHVKKMFDRQSYGNKVLLATNAVTLADYQAADIIAFFDGTAEYGPFYLEDMINAFKYTACDYVTKAAYVKDGKLVSGVEHDYVSSIVSKCQTVFWREAFELGKLKAISGSCDLPNGYACDHFNFSIGSQAEIAQNPEISVIIPVYNNGWFLYGRSFASVQRSSLFGKIEVLLIDDGSTDPLTRAMTEHLTMLYPGKVRSYFFGDGGSGTASRPRNKGVEMAKGKYVTFLDPDDELVGDALVDLEHESEAIAADFAFANTLMRQEKRTYYFKYYEFNIKPLASVNVIRDCARLQQETGLQTVRVQGMLIRRDFLVRNKFTQVVGGAGEDTFLYQQMLTKAKCAVRVWKCGAIYYFDRDDSVVNTVSLSFYEKYHKTEVIKCRWFADNGLMDVYISKRFVPYLKSWHFERLSHVAESQREICTRRLYDIIRLYEPYYHGGDAKLDAFIAACKKGSWMEAYSAAVAK